MAVHLHRNGLIIKPVFIALRYHFIFCARHAVARTCVLFTVKLSAERSTRVICARCMLYFAIQIMKPFVVHKMTFKGYSRSPALSTFNRLPDYQKPKK